MKILRLYPFLPPQPGGMEKHVARLSVYQRALGHDVTIAFCEGAPTSVDDIRLLGGQPIRAWKPVILRELFFYTAALIALRRRRSEFDVMHVHGDWAAAACGRLLAWALDVPVRLFSAHGYLRQSPKSLHVLHIALQGYAAGYATGAREAALMQRCMPDAEIWWQPSGIEEKVELYNTPFFSHVDVICVANFYPVKNVSLVLDIAALLPHRSFRIVGDGPERAVLESKVYNLGLANVEFTGSASEADVQRYLRAASIFLITSLTEGTPTSMMEAIAAGLPVISSPSNNYDALITSSVHGYILSCWEPDDYAERIEVILTNPALRAAMSTANLARSEQFGWSYVAERITSVMLTCLQRRSDQ